MERLQDYYNDDGAKKRLWEEYCQYDQLIVAVDFDSTIRPYKVGTCDDVVALLQECTNNPKICLCFWGVFGNDDELKEKLDYCESVGIHFDYINESPHKVRGKEESRKIYYNILLDDRAGLESAYNTLKYVIDKDNESK